MDETIDYMTASSGTSTITDIRKEVFGDLTQMGVKLEEWDLEIEIQPKKLVSGRTAHFEVRVRGKKHAD